MQQETISLRPLAQIIARAGICSRRKAQDMIARGEVKVNGILITSPCAKILESDQVEVGGKILAAREAIRLWILYKKSGYVTTNNDPEFRPTIFDLLPKNMPRVITVGRLDINTEGLLLLTNDGEYARELELPQNNVNRIYQVRVFGTIDLNKIKILEKGAFIDGVKYKPAQIKITTKSRNSWLKITISEGKNREIRNMMDFLGVKISRLIRIAYGDFQLNKLNPGDIIEVTPVITRRP